MIADIVIFIMVVIVMLGKILPVKVRKKRMGEEEDCNDNNL